MTPAEALVLLLITPVAPLALALLLLRRRDSSVLHTAAALAALPALVTSALMPAGIAATLPWLLEGSEFGLDVPGRLFLFFSAAIWLASGLHARQSVDASRRGRFFVFFLLVMSGNLGLIVARDILAFYLFFVLMSFSTYGLIVHDASDEARRAGRIYMTLVVAADMMLFGALVLAALETGGTLLFEIVRESVVASEYRDVIIALVVAGFGVKLGLIGLHVTLPLMYRAAPTPAAAVLAGALINAGLLAWLRFLPLGGEFAGWGDLLLIAGIVAAFYGVLVGVAQKHPATVLAYSSISQLGVMTAGVGAALSTAAHAAGIVAAIALYAMHHAFTKSALFLGAGLATEPRHGLPRVLLRAGLLLPSLALIGAPLTSGMLVKEYLKEMLEAAGRPAVTAFASLLPWTAVATTLIIARFLWLAWPGTAAGEVAGRSPMVSAARAAPWLALLLLSGTAVWLLPLENPPELLSTSAVWETSWPLIAGAVVAAGVGVAVRSGRAPRPPNVPPGDVVVAAEWASRRVARAWNRFARELLPGGRERLRGLTRAARTHPVWSRLTGGVESGLRRWEVALALFVALTFVIITATVWH